MAGSSTAKTRFALLPGHDGRCVGCRRAGVYAASTSTSSESSSAVILSCGLVADRDAVAGVDANAVDLDAAGRRHQIEVARFAGRVLRALAGFQRGGKHPRVGTDRQCVLVIGKSAGDGDEIAGAVRFRERFRAPGRLAALRLRFDPDLEDLGRLRLQIVFGVTDTGAGAHHLNVARFGAALVAEAVLMGDRALADIGDDFHVGVGCGGKAGVRRDLVVVPHPQGAVAHIAGVVVTAEREVVFCFQPAVVGAAEPVEGSEFNHGIFPRVLLTALDMHFQIVHK